MRDELFQELLQSVREAGETLRNGQDYRAMSRRDVIEWGIAATFGVLFLLILLALF